MDVQELMNEEKKQWKDENTTDEWKLENLKKNKIKNARMAINTFEESYNHKIKQGISLFKKKILEKKFTNLFS